VLRKNDRRCKNSMGVHHFVMENLMDPPPSTYDVAILGGGLAGSCLARQLLVRRPHLRVLLLEKRTYPAPEAAFKVGESTIEVGAHYLAEEVGLKKHLVEEQLPKFGLRFFFDHGRRSLDDATEVGLSEFFPTPGYQIDRGRLENHLAENVRALGAHFRQGATVKQVDLESGEEVHTVSFEEDGSLQRAEARWVVDASGRAGILKRKLDLRKPVEHQVNAAWFRLQTKICIDAWCENPQWRNRTGKVERRWLSTNHLLGRGYWIWIIPLASGSTSIGIVADPRLHSLDEFSQFDKALEWIQRNEPLCAEAILPFREQVQDFKAMKHLAYGCEQVYSADRWALTGEAGVFLDPLYSPGIDYIAMSNNQILSLIEHDLDGEAIDLLAPRYQGIFLTLFEDNLRTYQDQYPLFGNPRVMSLKYVWDYALYWSFPGLLYFHGKFTDPRFFAEMGEKIESIRELNKRMQAFFLEWDAAEPGHGIDPVFINQNEIDILRQLNGELRDSLDDRELEARFRRNVSVLHDLASEITARASAARPDLLPDKPDAQARVPRLGQVFEALGI